MCLVDLLHSRQLDKTRQLEAQRTKLLEAKAAELKSLHQALQREKENELQTLIQERDREEKARIAALQKERELAEAELVRRVRDETTQVVEKVMGAELEQAHKDLFNLQTRHDKVINTFRFDTDS